ncbi:hypothetical protein A2870_02135 [Candidatus Curtissbacteria bacterium RIFCSPHIGHO2_01_FULL_41_11]|uniref:Glycosyltransferase RgtA/B/C/D-like domain-containing protein n=1 Tax=Candidatus Curtissbacteria bacterium RIFCSPHIGHO2_01_FULL_41_11 TaxID=1797711 RepID=A0A1F5G3W4_9BACT|nr:MAG: hypothetical protein A2870_02135 [Candidatus Curtissbacteria bacterium RIFCSPHIGHO2_01_FULL_41_11]
MGKVGKYIFFALIALNLILASWYVLHGDLYTHSDISRDLLLLGEISEKKIVLIGQRAGIDQLFHGPLWLYLNHPAYLLGGGNPVAVGWFWIVLSMFFLVGSFFVARDLLGKTAAYYFVLLLSTFLISHAKDMSHPMGALFTSPFFFFAFYKYVKTLKARYLVFSVLLAGVMLQFEMAGGIPFLLLLVLFSVYLIVKKRNFAHFLAFLTLFLPISTFILFDIRHGFVQLQGWVNFLSEESAAVNYLKIIGDRLNFITTAGTPFLFVFRHEWVLMDIANRLISVTFFGLILLMMRRGVQRGFFALFLYFYFGYFFIASLKHGALLIHQAFSLVPLVFLAFVALLGTKYKQFITILLIGIIAANEIAAIEYVDASIDFRGKSEDSWSFLHRLEKDIFEGSDAEFGYFTYSPDAFSYQSKAAMVYGALEHPDKRAFYFEKMPVTYLVLAPAALSDPYAKYFKADWWTKNTLRIDKQPQSAIDYPNGYRVERYELTPEEMTVPWDKSGDTGIHFR